MKCSNCNATLSCGCQKRIALDGTGCCTSCISLYEKKLIANGPKQPVTSTEPVVQPNVWETNRYVNIKR